MRGTKASRFLCFNYYYPPITANSKNTVSLSIIVSKCAKKKPFFSIKLMFELQKIFFKKYYLTKVNNTVLRYNINQRYLQSFFATKKSRPTCMICIYCIINLKEILLALFPY